MLRWKPAPKARIGSNVEGLFFSLSLSLCAFFPTAPAPAETSQAIAGFPNSAAPLLIITRLASSSAAPDPKLLDILKPYTLTP
jgi:hypothetical protein